MPIIGLSDRGLSFPEIGQLRKGAAKTDPRKPGADLNYFRVIFDEKEQEAAIAFNRTYGLQPDSIRIILPFNEIDRMWDAWLEAYTAGRMVARADGEKYIYLIDTSTGEMLVKNGIDIKTGQPRPYVEGAPVGYYTSSSGKIEPVYCKPSGRLKVIIPELVRAAYLTVLTTSIHDIANISDQLRAFQTLNGSRIAGIPLILRRRPKKISTPGPDGTRARRIKWLISIEADPEWVRRALQETKRLALPGNGLSLPEPQIGPHSGVEIDPDPEPETGLEQDVDEGEYEDGEYTQVETQQAQTPAPAPANGNGNGRPYAPKTLRKKLQDAAKNRNGATVTPKQVGLVAMLLGKAFAGNDDSDLRRHAVQMYLFGVEGLGAVPPAVIKAMLDDWLKPVKDSGGDFTPDAMAVREITMVYAEALKTQGQQELPF